MNVRETAVNAVALRVLADRVATASSDAKAALAEGMDVGDRKTAALTDGTAVGSITYTKGTVTASVTDERALLAWVTAHHPEELVSRINDAYRSKLLADAKTNGDHAVDVTSGEIVPGITVRTGAPHISVRPNPDAVPALVDAMRGSHELALDGPRSPLSEAL